MVFEILKVGYVSKVRPVAFLLAVVDAPISFPMIAELKQSVFGVVPFPAIRTHQEPAPLCALPVVLLGNCEARAAAARDQKHPKGAFRALRLGRMTLGHYLPSSTITATLFFRLFDCRTFLRRRRALGVTSTNSSSAMNSIACSRFSWRKGIRRMASSDVEARMLVSFFSRTTLTSRSVSFAFSPMIIPS